MKKQFKDLLIINLITYINNLIYIYVSSQIIIKDLLALWVLSPLVFIFKAYLIHSDDNKEKIPKYYYKLLTIDTSIRVLAYGIAFFNYQSKYVTIIKFILVILLMFISFYLEIILFKKSHSFKFNEKKKIVFSEEEKYNLRAIGRASTIGVVSFIMLVAGAMNITLTVKQSQNSVIISTIVYVFYVYLSFRKIDLFYLDKIMAKKVFLKDTIFSFIAYSLNLSVALCIRANILNVDGSLITQAIISMSPIIGIIILYPNIMTNKLIAKTYRDLVRFLGDDFEYYFTHSK